MSRRSWITKLQVPAGEGTAPNSWANDDLRPLPKHRRTFGPGSFFLYWITCGFSIVNYSTGSSLIAYGLTGRQALICAIVAPFFLSAGLYGTSVIGARHHINFVIYQRQVLGIYGAFFTLFIRTLPGVIYDGIEAYWGGQCIAAVFGAISPSYYTKLDVDLANGTLKLYDLVGFLVFYFVFLLVMRIPPEKLQRSFLVSCIFFAATVIGFLAWTTKTAGGAGPYFDPSFQSTASATNTNWSIMLGIMSFAGLYSMVTGSFMDWGRYAKTTSAPLVMQIAMPLCMSLACCVGIVVASCTEKIFGEAIWQPYQLLRAIQLYYNNSSSARAAVFFAAAACFFAQINLNVVLNAVACGMDLAAVAPRWLNIRRATYLVALLGFCTCPWAVLASASQFLAVLAGFGVFAGPMTALALVDYFYVRRMHVSLPDLYIGDSSSIYWYAHGFNWRAFLSLAAGIAPTFPGFIMTVINPERGYDAWIYMYHLAYIVGLGVTAVVHAVVCTVFPPPHRLEGTTVHIDEDEVEGTQPAWETEAEEKWDMGEGEPSLRV